jgi:hypothetical protein
VLVQDVVVEPQEPEEPVCHPDGIEGRCCGHPCTGAQFPPFINNS